MCYGDNPYILCENCTWWKKVTIGWRAFCIDAAVKRKFKMVVANQRGHLDEVKWNMWRRRWCLLALLVRVIKSES